MRIKQKGFTLIELVVVIVILGILAAVAAPKFIDVSGDAYVAKVEAAEASLKSANSLVYSKAIIHNIDLGDQTLSFGNQSVNITNGYVRATPSDIASVLDIEFSTLASLTDNFDTDYGIFVEMGTSGKTEVSILPRVSTSTTLACGLKYTFDMSTPSEPIYTTYTDCD